MKREEQKIENTWKMEDMYSSDQAMENDLDKALKMISEYNKYKDISRRVNDLYLNYTSKKEPHETSGMNKVMTWWGVQMNTMSDKSNSNLSELLLNGTNMGIIEGRRLLNQNPNINKDIHSLLADFVKMQEDSVEKLKSYL